MVVDGDVGDNVGVYMVAGTVVITGCAGELIGNWMVRGEIFVKEHGGLGNNARETSLTNRDRKKLENLLKTYGIECNLEKFKKIVPVKLRPFYS